MTTTPTTSNPTTPDKPAAREGVTYERVMAAIKEGAGVTAEDLATARAYAKRTKSKRPYRAILVAGQNHNKGKACSVRGCDNEAMALTKCSMHYARAYRTDPAKRAKANEASRKWAAKHRKSRSEVKAAKAS